MASTVKTYYFPPNWDIPPGGPLSLGCVLSSIKRPLPPLLISPLTELLSATTPSTTDDQLQQPRIYPTTKQNVSYRTSTSHSGSASLFASFAAPLLGIGPDASASLARDHSLTLRFTRVDTKEWYPSAAELQRLVEQSPVSRYLDRLQAWSPKCVLVVTGVKVAYGARVESRDAREVKGDLSVSLDPGVAVGVPGAVEFGPGLGLGRKRSAEVGWETGVDGHEDPGFVFAYQVQRVKVKKRNAEVIDVVSKAYTRGAVYGSGHVANEPGEYEIDITDADDSEKEEGLLVEAIDGEERMRLVPL